MCVGGSGGGSIQISDPPDLTHEYEKRRERLREAQRNRQTLLGGGISSTIKTSPMGVAGMTPSRTLLGSSNEA